MTTLFFICVIACIFASIAMFESSEPASRHLRAGFGLVGWLVRGNWPAKVGGGLLIVGVGALLRYTLLHIDVAPVGKLASGALLSVTLFGAANLVRTRYGRREIAVALSGAAFGIAYLTAYSAFGLFHYLDDFAGLALLAAVAIGAGAYAIQRNAISLALLAMFGAFIAPTFALDRPSPEIVYGYYIAMSQLTLVMVAMRGWRALTHLSFMFTLAGGVFFAATADFYTPANFATMQPLLLILTAIHVAMPLAERKSPLSKWRLRSDKIYFVALPVVGALSLLSIAPSVAARSNVLLMLGGLWALAALATRILRIEATLGHAVIAGLFIALGAYVRTPEWPWFLIAEAMTVVVLVASCKLRLARAYQDVIAGCVLIFAGLFAAATLNATVSGAPFVNSIVIERLIGGVLLIVAWRASHKVNHPLAAFFGWLGGIALANTVAVELYRWNFASWPIVLHCALIAVAFVVAATAHRRPFAKYLMGLLAIAIVGTASWAAPDTNSVAAGAMALIAPFALILLGLRSDVTETDYANADRVIAFAVVPLVAWLWTQPLARSFTLSPHCALSVAMFTAIAAIAAATAVRPRAERWIDTIVGLFGTMFGGILLFFTLFQIDRGVWPVSLDVLCLAGLALLLSTADRDAAGKKALYLATAVGAALVIQAMLLRVLGPDRTMTIADAFHLHYPAVISLFWSALGASLTLIARKVRSRTLWSAGAVVLIACAAKLVLLDFGSFGELANILAVITSGLVFLLVSWLAPLPPKEPTLADRN